MPFRAIKTIVYALYFVKKQKRIPQVGNYASHGGAFRLARAINTYVGTGADGQVAPLRPLQYNFEHCLFEANRAFSFNALAPVRKGGAIYNTEGFIALKGTKFVGNRATQGEGGSIYSKDGVLVATADCTFVGYAGYALKGEAVFVVGNTLSEAGNHHFTYRLYDTEFVDKAGNSADHTVSLDESKFLSCGTRAELGSVPQHHTVAHTCNT